MAKYRKSGRKTGVRLALLRSQVAVLIANGEAVTTEARAKEVREVVEFLTALAVKEEDNSETVSVTAKMPRKDANSKRVREERDSKRVVVYGTVQKEVKKDRPSRMNARCHMLMKPYAVGEFDPKHRKVGKKVDLVVKLFDEHGPKYEGRRGGYIRIVKIGLRKGDAAMEVLLELVQAESETFFEYRSSARRAGILLW